MLKSKIKNLLKMNTEFGGAEPPATENTGIELGTGAEPEGQEGFKEPGGVQGDGEEAEPEPEPEPFNQTKAVSARIRQVRVEAKEQISAAEARSRALEQQLAEKNNGSAEFLQARGYVNPYNGQTIDTYHDYLAYKQAFDGEQQAANPPDIDDIVERRVAEAMGRRQAEQDAARRLSADIAQISRMNPAIKTVHDLETLSEAQAILEKVSRGYSVYDAYITSVTPAKSQNRPDTTGHMVPTGGNIGGGGMATIPADQLASWKEDFPSDTMEQLTQRYNRALKA